MPRSIEITFTPRQRESLAEILAECGPEDNVGIEWVNDQRRVTLYNRGPYKVWYINSHGGRWEPENK